MGGMGGMNFIPSRCWAGVTFIALIVLLQLHFQGVYVWSMGVATGDVGAAHGNMWDVQLVERLEKRLRELTGGMDG